MAIINKKNKKIELGKELRKQILRLAAGTGTKYPHIGSCLSCIDLIIETQFFQMGKQDKFILSKGHASLALLVVLNKKGRISDKDMGTYFKDGGLFGVHPPPTFPRDIPLPTGSLGHGLSFASGLAKGFQLLKAKNFTASVQHGPIQRVFCLMSDGECNEGAVWEAALFAAQHKLNNLIAIIDKNGFQGIDATKNVLGDAASKEKWQAFGFNVEECDGHDFKALEKAFTKIETYKNNKPGVIIANTKRGQGIKSLEGRMDSNYFALNEENLDKFLKELS